MPTYSVVAGYGQVGQAVAAMLQDAYYSVATVDVGIRPIVDERVSGLHICFPYTADFAKQVLGYQKSYRPIWTVVHSTVPVGTCRELGVYHAPVRGVHPHLREGLQTFTTYLAPRNYELAAYLTAAGFRIQQVDNPDATEAAKLWCTTALGWNVMLEKEIYRYCQLRGIDFDFVYREWTETYNWGFRYLDMGHVARPTLKHQPGPIGGHCVMPNVELLGGRGELITEALLDYQAILCVESS